MTSALFLVLTSLAVQAQPPVAPTPDPNASARGENTGGYNILNSFEAGYRWRTTDGNAGKYRSDINYGNGLRLFSSRLRINSREGQGRLFDEIVLNTQGMGNDPYESAVLRVEKNRLYRYDMLWRLSDYFNPALTIAGGQRLIDTRRTFQDHDFTLFPQGRYKLFLGYSRNSQYGPGLSTVQLFDARGDEFPLFLDVRRQRNEYRLGGEATVAGFTLNVLHGWDNFKDDTPLGLRGPEPGNNPADNTSLSALRRLEPYHGNSPYWRIGLFRNERRYGVNARYTNVSGRRDFVFDEAAAGTDRFASARNRQILVAGSGSRPVTAGSLNLSLMPTGRLTMTNHSSFHNTRMDGSGAYSQVDNNQPGVSTRSFQFLGIRSIQTLTDATFRVTRVLGLYSGYHYSHRRIQSREGFEFSGATDVFAFEQENRVHSGLAGVRLKPARPLTIQVDAEIGRADRPFYPISEKNYHAINGRVQYKSKSLLLAAWTRTLYNVNSVSLFSHSSRSRQYAFDASYTPRSWLSFDAGYSKAHLDTRTGLAFFAGSLISDQRSLYLSNLHAANLGVRGVIGKRAELWIGYSIVRDTGDGRSSATGQTGAALPPGFLIAQAFPLSYQSPEGRLSVRLHKSIRWNFGYQFYAYREDFWQLTFQNYRAHTGYTSLLWSF